MFRDGFLVLYSTIIGIDVLYAKEATLVLKYTIHGTWTVHEIYI